MRTGSSGTFVVPWSDTAIDDLPDPPREALAVGATWRYSGEALRIDGTPGVLQLCAFVGQDEMRDRAARAVRRLIGVAPEPRASAVRPEDPGSDRSVVLTDGVESYRAEIVELPGAQGRLLVFVGTVPPPDQDLWVVRISRPLRSPRESGQEGGMICFTPGTHLATPDGPRLIETLRPGDLVSTRDNGPQPILWCGHRRMSGARLYALPQLRPIRIRSDAFGIGQPDRALIVSPRHRMLVRGRAAEALFGTDEVLVAAEDLLDDRSVLIDHQMREVTYVHVMLEHHQIVWANGLLTESFHPAADLARCHRAVAARRAVVAALGGDPLAYGPPARRMLTGAEAAILRHRLAA